MRYLKQQLDATVSFGEADSVHLDPVPDGPLYARAAFEPGQHESGFVDPHVFPTKIVDHAIYLCHLPVQLVWQHEE